MTHKDKMCKDLSDLIESDLFDSEWYRNTYPEADHHSSPAAHYIEIGAVKGYDPSITFNTRAYLDANPDVAAAGVNPVLHYIRHGRAEGRETAPSTMPRYPGDMGAKQVEDDRALMAQAFDEAFYRATNPDLAQANDLLDHFIRFGWMEGRDPCSAFSTEFYMIVHKDVAEQGLNPFLHWLKYGRTEARAVRPSSRHAVRVETGPQLASESLRTGVVVMVKNEIDIIQAFMEHILALFDVVAVVDHMSEDGTQDFLKALDAASDRVTLYKLEEPGYIQALTMNHVVKTCPALREVDWVFLLDADEFLPFQTRQEFTTALTKCADAPVIAMKWMNLIPEIYWEFEVHLDDKTAFLTAPEPSPYTKIAYQPAKMAGNDFWIDQGNHAVFRHRNGVEVPTRLAEFPLYHLPIRSADQFMLKLNQGVLAYLRLGQSRDKLQGSHWFQMRRAIQEWGMSADVLNAVAVDYGQEGARPMPISASQLSDRGFLRIVPALARQRIEATAQRRTRASELIFQMNAEAALLDAGEVGGRNKSRDVRLGVGKHSPDPGRITRLITGPDGIIRRADDDPGTEYESLVDRPPSVPCAFITKAADTSDAEFLTAFLRPSYWEVNDLTPTAWGGHIPFLFSLVAAERPRRFVELGTHFGASFFSYCQSVERTGFDSEAVAIDTWEGDEHTSSYDESVFDHFRFLLRKYDRFAGYLRMFFDDAAPRFAECSIDLLHIDGFHTYEAVSKDFETWLPKMSDQGIMLFHDINVHERDFGVWKLWRDLRNRYPSLELVHSHGLGLIYVGGRADRPILRLIEMVRADSGIGALLQQHFEEVGQKAAGLFIKGFELSRLEAEAVTAASLREEISRLQQRLGIAEAEAEQMRALLNDAATEVA